MQNMILNNTF